MPNRNYSLDVIRTISILFVVANHAIDLLFPSSYKTNGVELFCNMTLTNQIFQFVVFTMGRLGVPLFFMLTGYLLVTRDYSTKDKILSFYKKNLLGLVLVWYVWILFYNVFILVFEQKQIVINDILLELMLMKNVPLMHTWYMNEIIVIYALIPLLAYILNKIGLPKLFLIGVFLVAVTNVLFGGIPYVGFIVPKLIYIAYVIAGYYFATSRSHIDRRVCFAIFVIGFLALVWWQISSYHNMNPQNVWYTNPLHYLVSLFLSSLLFRKKWVKKGRFAFNVEMISRVSFGIYLLHVPVMKIVLSIMQCLNDAKIINVALFFLISISASTIIIMLISRIPIIGKTIFYIK